jgi:steroid delta-isomerase-like uncharacterized protein
MSEQNKAAVRVVFDTFNGGDLDALDEVVAEDAVDHDPYNPYASEGREGLKQLIADYRESFPDLVVTIDDMIAGGDKVVVRWTASGTQQGEVFGVPGSGRRSTVGGIGIDRLEGGRIVESWAHWDTLGMLQQLGAIPEAQPAQT